MQGYNGRFRIQPVGSFSWTARCLRLWSRFWDPRVDRTKLHPLTNILVLSVPAVICGADSFVAIALFGELHEE